MMLRHVIDAFAADENRASIAQPRNMPLAGSSLRLPFFDAAS
jgi:hypothetical protein